MNTKPPFSGALPALSQSVDGEPVTAEEIDDSLRSAPHLFQARVRKVADVRVLRWRHPVS
ncbi:hypothetical protein [Streptomyces sp. CA-253872]|uniref:hypothetical protein n=1 Tax=Streptomyces sp. CA-253872 TaxID=3240067 RepID=UPI003D8BDAA9